MLTFEPPQLETDFRNTIAQLTDHMSVLVGGEDLNKDFDLELFEDEEWTASTEVKLEFPRSDTDAEMSIEDLIELTAEVTDPKTSFDGLVYHSSVRTVIRAQSWDLRSMSFAERAVAESGLGAVVGTEIGGRPASVGLRSISPHYAAIIVLRDHFWDKYNPPVQMDDVWIEVTHETGADKEAAIAVIQAYLFELHASLGVEYSESPRPTGDVEYPEDEEISDLILMAEKLRPLLLGQGLLTLLQEFNRGYGPQNSEAALLCYVKCIEYVAATVVRERQYEDLRKRLLSREALNPNADYLDGLLRLVEENRVFTRDAEALKLSVERCCDSVPMAPHAPKYLRRLAAVSAQSGLEDRKSALSDMADALTATRNQLAHAKANYKSTGKECPPEQIDSLVACAKLAAEQCIRWYAARSPELRRG
jgi:hypothetical protein